MGALRACVEVDAQGLVLSIMEEFKTMDYSKWQKTEAEERERKSPPRRVTLPLLTNEDKKKKGEKNKPVAFMLSKKTPLPSETSPLSSFAQRKLALKEAELAKTMEEIKIITDLTNLKKNAIEELKQHSAHLAEANSRLIKDIQHTDDTTAKQAKVLLQQYEVFQRMKAKVQTSNQNQLDTARAELQEMEKTMEKNLGRTSVNGVIPFQRVLQVQASPSAPPHLTCTTGVVLQENIIPRDERTLAQQTDGGADDKRGWISRCGAWVLAGSQEAWLDFASSFKPCAGGTLDAQFVLD
ncbi:hypothetical protein llap_12304 [Limosa lapponica baueri]|uniref:Uncharacterized protein n=1 Tax=Limosa lapponica baueri TaxID=1758121 RepID=A0A2I0TUC8_LIMLA|nr:hypothetical protein llap_12304 [Limosa lapponica baueri]